MKITIFGCTGNVGKECLQQAITAGHDITVLLRSPAKLPEALTSQLEVVQGDGLEYQDVLAAISAGTRAVVFAVGVDEKTSPENLCTDVTINIIKAMRERDVKRLVWCGGGSNLLPGDDVGFGAKFVRWYAEHFLKLRHFDKEHQLELLNANLDIDWIGARPLQMKQGPHTGQYRVGYDRFGPTSSISFADCADFMLSQLTESEWIHKAPIIQY